MLHYRLEHYPEALEDLHRYVEAAPGDVNTGAIRLLDQLRLRQEGSGEIR
jgi:regulator of sirC expression with transglutaminase-like and TPR domain